MGRFGRKVKRSEQKQQIQEAALGLNRKDRKILKGMPLAKAARLVKETKQ